ncbi:MAG TPA: MFS transporter [Actinomycetes bacterium]|nr:MFS transporter [Actinomycetes bacterium]
MSTQRGSPLRPFRSRPYLIIWLGAFVSNIGTWMESVAVGVYVTQATGKAGWTGTIAALTFLPTTLFGPFAGALADRFDRRRYLALVTLAQAGLAGALTVLAAADRLTVARVAVIVFLSGCAFAFLIPAWSAILPDLVPTEDVLAATSLSQAQFNLGRVVGPALAGLVIGIGGVAWAFGANTLSFAAVLVSVALIRLPRPARDGPREPVLDQIRAGLTLARRDPGIRTALALLGAMAVLVSPFIGLVPAVAIKVFHAGAAGAALLVTAQGVGAVLAALAAGPLGARFGPRALLVAALLAVGPAAVLYGLSPTFPVAMLALLVLGFVYLSVLGGTATVCQLRAPREFRGRIASLFMLVLGSGYPLGLVVHGWLGDRVGLPVVTTAGGLAMLGIVLAVRAVAPDDVAALDPVLPAEAGR